MSNNKNNIVLLDLGGVVFQSTGISNRTIDWKIITALNYKYGHDLNIGKDVFSQFMAEYNERTNQNLQGKAFLTGVFDTLKINQELIDLLSKHYEIIIVSDNYRENIQYISERYRFSSWAKQQIYSFDYEMEKSNPAFFKRLIKEVECDLQHLIYIDDSEHKLQSARESGIHGVLFKSNEQIKQALSI